MTENRLSPNFINKLKKVSLNFFIGFFSINALIGIIVVTTDLFGEYDFEILGTASVLTGASICIFSNINYMNEANSSKPGIIGIILAFSSTVMVILGIWGIFDSNESFEVTFILTIFSIAAAHSLGLLTVNLKKSHNWVKKLTAVNIFLSAFSASFLILGETDQNLIILISVFSILSALGTLVVPLLNKMSAIAEDNHNKLFLTKLENGLYKDKHGNIYLVKKEKDIHVDLSS